MEVRYIYPEKTHKRTFIILHGMNQGISDIEYIVKNINKSYDDSLFIILIAKKMDINWPSGIEKNLSSWYNYYTRNDDLFIHDNINTKQFRTITDEVVKIINKEHSLNKKDIHLVGISQGGTIAINSSIKLKFKIKNVICIDTIFMNNYTKNRLNVSQNFRVLQSKYDDVYNIIFQDKCYYLLSEKGHNVIKTIRDKGHCEDLNYISRFIFSCI